MAVTISVLHEAVKIYHEGQFAKIIECKFLIKRCLQVYRITKFNTNILCQKNDFKPHIYFRDKTPKFGICS